MKIFITVNKIAKFKDIAKDFAQEALLEGHETEAEIENVTFFVASTMAIGARFKRNEHIGTGILIGVGASALALTIGSTIGNIRDSQREEELKKEFEQQLVEQLDKDNKDYLDKKYPKRSSEED